MTRRARDRSQHGPIVAFVCLAVLAVSAYGPLPAAASGDAGYRGPSSGSQSEVTATKPESKLWWNDGSWWASMWDVVTSDFHIFRLNMATQTWSDTGVPIDTRSNTKADTLWDGTHLYVASHAFTNVPGSGQPSYLYRYSYDPSTDKYMRDTGFPVAINNYRTETLVIDKDSTGQLWATWVQDTQVYVNRTLGDDRTWGTPFPIGVNGSSGLNADDISSLVAFGGNRIGVMWSNQNASAMYFAAHADADPDEAWQGSGAVFSGPNNSDDHINMKSDSTGRLFAVIKTSHTVSTQPFIVLLVHDPASGTWASHTVSRVSDKHTRPILVLDEANKRIHVLAAAGQAGGTIYRKTSSMGAIAFPAGQGEPFINDAASFDMNDPSSTKQTVNGTTGLVVLGSNNTTDYYWHNFDPLGVPALAAAFTATPTSGTTPLAVAFTDTSGGGPVSWSWDFGDGTPLASDRHPTHTYQTAGSYTVSLTVTDASGATSARVEPAYINVAAPSASSALTFAPAADAYTRSGAATTNFGTRPGLSVKYGSTNDYMSYLQFSVQGLSGPVIDARLRLWVTNGGRDGGSVYTVGSAWVEREITWSNAPPVSSGALASAGSIVTGTWVEVSLPPSLYAGGDGTYSFALVGSDPTSSTISYSSREGVQPPQLVLTVESP